MGSDGNGLVQFGWWSNRIEPKNLKFLYVNLNRTNLSIQTELNRRYVVRFDFQFGFAVF